MEELDWAAILGTGGSLRQGYFALDVVQADRPHPFVSVPHRGRGGPHRGAGQAGWRCR